MGKSMQKEKIKKLAITLGLWILVIWLLYPLITLNSMAKFNLNPYLFRSTIGILIRNHYLHDLPPNKDLYWQRRLRSFFLRFMQIQIYNTYFP
jgi:hypothetical protein